MPISVYKAPYMLAPAKHAEGGGGGDIEINGVEVKITM